VTVEQRIDGPAVRHPISAGHGATLRDLRCREGLLCGVG
jgi:hypothetical protein